MQVSVKSVDIEKVTKGKNFWNKAVVTYDFKGDTRKQTIVSFANPEVFKTIKDLVAGDMIDVQLTKDANDYTQWSQVTKLGGEAPAAAAAEGVAKTVAKTVTSNYETKDERAARQVLIVKQSSIGAAVEHLKARKDANGQDVLDLAQKFTDWVFVPLSKDIFNEPNDPDLGVST